MISAVTPEPAVSGISDYRHRPALAERTVLQDSVPPAPNNSGAKNDSGSAQTGGDTPAPPTPWRNDGASMFAASVIAGILPPIPTTMEELILRIGASPIPPESEARLKDLLA